MTEANVKFDFSSFLLEIEMISGTKKLNFKSIYLWHFPINTMIMINKQTFSSEAGIWNWLEPLPNFDPFEEKGKTYFNTCQVIHLPQ
jgi:hypothetical protein